MWLESELASTLDPLILVDLVVSLRAEDGNLYWDDIDDAEVALYWMACEGRLQLLAGNDSLAYSRDLTYIISKWSRLEPDSDARTEFIARQISQPLTALDFVGKYLQIEDLQTRPDDFAEVRLRRRLKELSQYVESNAVDVTLKAITEDEASKLSEKHQRILQTWRELLSEPAIAEPPN